MKQSLRFLSIMLIISCTGLRADIDNNYFNPPANAVIKGPANARGVDNVDCCNSEADQVEVTLSKVCVVDEKMDTITDTVDALESKLCDMVSAIDEQSAIADLSNEFGGTFTALEEVISKLCVVEDGVDEAIMTTEQIESKACVVESKVDALDVSGTITAEFNETFTAIAAVQSKVCVVDDKMVDNNLTADDITSKVCVVESKLENIDVSDTIKQEFNGTFTLIAEALSKACVIEDGVTELDATTDAIFSKECVIESKVDAFDVSDDLADEFKTVTDSLQEITSKLCVIETEFDEGTESASAIFSKLCALEDEIDYLDISEDLADEFGGTFTLIESIISKICKIEGDVDVVDTTNDETLSKLCIIESSLDNQQAIVDVQSEFDGTFTALEDVISKVCVVEEKVDTTNENADTILSKVCAFESEVDAFDASADVQSEFDGTFTLLDTMLSKACVIDENVVTVLSQIDSIRTEDFGGTFTVIDIIFDKVCDIDIKLDNISASELDSLIVSLSQLEEIAKDVCETSTLISDLTMSIVDTLSELDGVLTTLNEELCSIADKVCDVEDKTNIITNELDLIRTEDFGGTFTLINGILDKLCMSESLIDDATGVTDDAFSKACIIESIADELVNEDIDLMDEFNDTFTLLKEKTSKICVIEEKSLEVQETANNIESKVCEIESTFDALDVSIDLQDEFGGTFTLIEELKSKVCVVEDTVDVIDEDADLTQSKLCDMEMKLNEVITSQLDLTEEFGGTYTALEESISKLCTIEDKTDTAQETVDETLSKVCVIDSKVDALDISENLQDEFASLFELLDTNLSKLCVVEDKVDIATDDTDELLSKVCVIESKVLNLDVSITATTEFGGTYTALEELISKICVIDDTTQNTDQTEDAIMSKLCVIESLVDTLDVSGNFTDEFHATWTALNTLEEKVCAGLCNPTLISQDDVPYTISSPGTYIVTENLTLTSPTGTIITVDSDNVVLDLCDKVLTGDGDMVTPVNGIDVLANHHNITIKNGYLRGTGPLDPSITGFLSNGINVNHGCELITIENIDIQSVFNAAIGIGVFTPDAGNPIRNVEINNCNILTVGISIAISGLNIQNIIENVEISNVRSDFAGGFHLLCNGYTQASPVRNVRVTHCQFTNSLAPGFFGVTTPVRFDTCENVTFEHSSLTHHSGAMVQMIECFECTKMHLEDLEVSCNTVRADTPQGAIAVSTMIEMTGCTSCSLVDVRVQDNTNEGGDLNGFLIRQSVEAAEGNLFERCITYNNSALNRCVGFNIQGDSLGFVFSTRNNQFVGCQALSNSSTTSSSIGFLMDNVSAYRVVAHECSVFVDCIANAQTGYEAGHGFSIALVKDYQFIRCIASCNQDTGFLTVTGGDGVIDTEFKDCQAMNNGVSGFDLSGADDTITMIRNIACFNG